ncbi:hypothetical protein CN601_11590 [Bacillus sp. AFS017336]|nr:hypothetical protein CN601_11590 [Bacillus sp. AFS017336]
MLEPLASRSSRLLAILVDIFISALFRFVFLLITGVAEFSTFTDLKKVEKLGVGSSIISIICVVIFYILIPTYVWKGQTIGKRWLKIAVVKEDNQEVNLGTMFVRTIFSFLGYVKIKYLSFIVGIVAFIDPFFIFTSERKTLHDRIAKTKVIDV